MNIHAQISSAVLDELCQFEESQFIYIQSRLRTKAKMKPIIRATMNPSVDSWVRKWVDWYLYPQGHEFFGRPDPAKQAVVRWFIRRDNEMYWGESRDELFERYGVRGSDGKFLPDKHKLQIKPLSFSFLSASVFDNPFIENSYIAFLEGLPRVEREILLHGSWEARPEASGFFKRQWLDEITSLAHASSEVVKTVRAYDLAGSLKSEINNDPDYSVGVKMSKLRDGSYIIEDIIRFRARFGEVMQKIIETAHEDGTNVDIILPREPGSAGLTTSTMMVRDITAEGFYVKCRPTSKSKIERFRPFASAAEHHLIKIVLGCAYDLENKVLGDNRWYYNEMEGFDGGRKGHDDAVDATGDAFSALNNSIMIPNMSIPTLTQTNPFQR